MFLTPWLYWDLIDKLVWINLWTTLIELMKDHPQPMIPLCGNECIWTVYFKPLLEMFLNKLNFKLFSLLTNFGPIVTDKNSTNISLFFQRLKKTPRNSTPSKTSGRTSLSSQRPMTIWTLNTSWTPTACSTTPRRRAPCPLSPPPRSHVPYSSTGMKLTSPRSLGAEHPWAVEWSSWEIKR